VLQTTYASTSARPDSRCESSDRYTQQRLKNKKKKFDEQLQYLNKKKEEVQHIIREEWERKRKK